MTSFRRGEYNFSLQRSCELSLETQKPLLILESLDSEYEWTNERFHQFVIDGMADNATFFSKRNVAYYPFIESSPGQVRSLIQELSKRACLIVTDDFPCSPISEMAPAVAQKVDCPLEAIDSNGIYPMRLAERTFTMCHSFRRFLQKEIKEHLTDIPLKDPLAKLNQLSSCCIPSEIHSRWPSPKAEFLSSSERDLSEFPIDHSVQGTSTVGGFKSGRKLLSRFFSSKLERYSTDRNSIDDSAASSLSPYFHFGHISTHEVLAKLIKLEDWNADKTAEKPNGSREGWWNMSQPSESFLDQFITWRELGYNMCVREENYTTYDSLPEFAQVTLHEHAGDRRPYVYELDELENSETHDTLWNAAQRELKLTGTMHNYLRMVWGKKILEWSEKPQQALSTMIHLNNKYALDGGNPNSYSGIFWCLGRYDRAWGPERPIFGKVRYMSSDNTARKIKVKNYLAQFSSSASRLF